MKARFPVMLAVALFMLAGCVESKPNDSPTPVLEETPLPKVTVTPSEILVVEETCHELGCDSAVSGYFENHFPQSFLVEIIDQESRKSIIHCLETFDEESYPHSLLIASLDSPEIEQIIQYSSAPLMCEEESLGMAAIYLRADGLADSVLVSCFAQTERQMQDAISGSPCFIDEENSEFSLTYPDDAMPEELNLIIHWETFTKTVSWIPEYETFQPNGPQCEPTCSTASISIELP